MRTFPEILALSAVGAVCLLSVRPSSAQLAPRVTSSSTKLSVPTPEAPKNQPLSATFTIGAAPGDPITKTVKSKCSDCTWTVTPWLIDKMSLNSDGTYTGKPTRVRVFHAAVVGTSATSGTEPEVYKDVQFTVFPANSKPAVTSANLPSGPVGQQYVQKLSAIESGNTKFTWDIDTSSLPPGLSADANGVITGSPTTAGTYTIKATAYDPTGNFDTESITMVIDASPGCAEPKYTNAYFNRWFAPLSHKVNTDPLGKGTWQYMTESDVQCFYQATGPTAPITQVQYIYGFGGGANTLSADMVSFQVFAPIGTQVSLGTSVTGGSTSGSSNTPSTPTAANALQSVEAGGDFYVHILYPLIVEKTSHLSLVSALDPKFGFSFTGFAGQSTLSQGNEQYFNVPVEMNGSLNGIADQGGVFFDYRGGLESVPGGFAKTAGLKNHNFFLNQLSFGLKFASVLQVGAQKLASKRSRGSTRRSCNSRKPAINSRSSVANWQTPKRC